MKGSWETWQLDTKQEPRLDLIHRETQLTGQLAALEPWTADWKTALDRVLRFLALITDPWLRGEASLFLEKYTLKIFRSPYQEHGICNYSQITWENNIRIKYRKGTIVQKVASTNSWRIWISVL